MIPMESKELATTIRCAFTLSLRFLRKSGLVRFISDSVGTRYVLRGGDCVLLEKFAHPFQSRTVSSLNKFLNVQRTSSKLPFGDVFFPQHHLYLSPKDGLSRCS